MWRARFINIKIITRKQWNAVLVAAAATRRPDDVPAGYRVGGHTGFASPSLSLARRNHALTHTPLHTYTTILEYTHGRLVYVPTYIIVFLRVWAFRWPVSTIAKRHPTPFRLHKHTHTRIHKNAKCGYDSLSTSNAVCVRFTCVKRNENTERNNTYTSFDRQ